MRCSAGGARAGRRVGSTILPVIARATPRLWARSLSRSMVVRHIGSQWIRSRATGPPPAGHSLGGLSSRRCSGFAGAAATTGMYFVSVQRHLLGAGLLCFANVAFSVAGVIYTAYLPRIAGLWRVDVRGAIVESANTPPRVL